MCTSLQLPSKTVSDARVLLGVRRRDVQQDLPRLQLRRPRLDARAEVLRLPLHPRELLPELRAEHDDVHPPRRGLHDALPLDRTRALRGVREARRDHLAGRLHRRCGPAHERRGEPVGWVDVRAHLILVPQPRTIGG